MKIVQICTLTNTVKDDERRKTIKDGRSWQETTEHETAGRLETGDGRRRRETAEEGRWRETAGDGGRRQEKRTKLDTDAGLHARPFKTHTRAGCP